jgi:hypothetical protein
LRDTERARSTLTSRTFVEGHGKSEVDSHFSHLSTWLKEATKQQPITTTAELLAAFRERADSHLRSSESTGAHRDSPAPLYDFVEYRPMCDDDSHDHYALPAGAQVVEDAVAVAGAQVNSGASASASERVERGRRAKRPREEDDEDDSDENQRSKRARRVQQRAKRPREEAAEDGADDNPTYKRLEGAPECKRPRHEHYSLDLPPHHMKLAYHWRARSIPAASGSRPIHVIMDAQLMASSASTPLRGKLTVTNQSDTTMKFAPCLGVAANSSTIGKQLITVAHLRSSTLARSSSVARLTR